MPENRSFADLKKEVADRLNQMERWYEKEYELSRSSGWSGFSEAKGEYRYIRNYRAAAESLLSSAREDPAGMLDRLEHLIREIPYDSDYPAPAGAMRRIRTMIDQLRQ